MKKIISLIVSFIAVFVIGIFIGHSILPPHPLVAAKDRPIYPTIYITGSSGYASTMDTMINSVTADKDTLLKKGLQLLLTQNTIIHSK
ncbi:alpha/beta hydrolase [Lactococcus cremoris]|nr:alpha/beta hydrolase [Lactococcus cremoris]MDM7653117.1 alpha/beta hydrolase [Lactococcus cremoris]